MKDLHTFAAGVARSFGFICGDPSFSDLQERGNYKDFTTTIVSYDII